MHRAVVDERHRLRQQAIQRTVAARLELALRGMTDLSEAELAAYVDLAYPTVAGGQTVAADTAASYIGVLAGPRMNGHRRRQADVAKALLRAGVLVQPDSRTLVAPVLRARNLVAEGEETAPALRAAASYAASLASNDLQASSRVGLAEGAAAAELDVNGWTKDLSSDACTWCQQIASGSYGTPDDVPYHDNERCGVTPDLDDGPDNYVYDDSDIPF
jgi:hypothetical protein